MWFDFDANWSIYKRTSEINMSVSGYAYCIFECCLFFLEARKCKSKNLKWIFFRSKHLRRQLACRFKFSWNILFFAAICGFFSTSDSRMAWTFFWYMRFCSSMISKNNSNIYMKNGAEWEKRTFEWNHFIYFKLNYGECEAQ